MASISEGSKIAVTKKDYLTFDQAKEILNGPKTSNIDTLWANKYAVTYFLSKVLSLNGFIPFFFDYSKAKAQDNKIAAQTKIFNDAVQNLVSATAARINQPAVSELARNNAAHQAQSVKLADAEQKALRNLAKTAVSILASNIDLSKATEQTVNKSKRAFSEALRASVVAQRGDLATRHIVVPNRELIVNAAVKYLAKNTSDVTQLDQKQQAEFKKFASKFAGMSENGIFAAVVERQAQKNPSIVEAVENKAAGIEKAMKKGVRFTSEEIQAVKAERKESLSKLKEEIKTLNADIKKAKNDIKKAVKNVEKAQKALVRAHNSHRAKGTEKLTVEEFHALCQANEFKAERMEGLLNKHTSPLFVAIADAAQAGVKAGEKGDKAIESRTKKRAELKELNALIRGARNNNANVLAELQAKRQAERENVNGILGFFNRGED